MRTFYDPAQEAPQGLMAASNQSPAFFRKSQKKSELLKDC